MEQIEEVKQIQLDVNAPLEYMEFTYRFMTRIIII